MASSIPNWLLYGGGLALLVGAYLDIRRQTIAGSLPTQFTQTLKERLETVEARLEEERTENQAYRAKSREWYWSMTNAMRAQGLEVPAPPEGFPG